MVLSINKILLVTQGKVATPSALMMMTLQGNLTSVAIFVSYSEWLQHTKCSNGLLISKRKFGQPTVINNILMMMI